MTTSRSLLKRPATRVVMLLAGLLITLMLVVVNLMVGSIEIPFNILVDSITNSNTADPVITAILFKFRLPQAITALMAGASLSVAGLMMQSLFRNPLADPSILGISSGASLGVALLILGAGAGSGSAFLASGLVGDLSITLAALAGAITVLSVIIFFSRSVQSHANLLILGIMIGYITFSAVGILKYYSPRESLQRFVIWGLGSFGNVSPSRLWLFTSLTSAGLLASFLMAKSLNLMLLGERYASNLGLNIRHARFFIILISGFLTAVVTAWCGPVAFIGLAVPHLTRNLLLTSSHHILLPASALFGSLLALMCNLAARLPVFDGTLPISAVTALVGAPVVIWLIFKGNR